MDDHKFNMDVNEVQLPLDTVENEIFYLLHQGNQALVLNQDDLDQFCSERFGEKADMVEDALLHGLSIYLDQDYLSLKVMVH